jgi:hypothetical protein
MSNLEQRENRRKSIVANMVNEPEQPATSGRGRPRENREKKKSVTLSLLPSLHEDIQKIAYVQRRSFSEVVTMLLEQYREEHQADISEYDRVKKG